MVDEVAAGATELLGRHGLCRGPGWGDLHVQGPQEDEGGIGDSVSTSSHSGHSDGVMSSRSPPSQMKGYESGRLGVSGMKFGDICKDVVLIATIDETLHNRFCMLRQRPTL